MALPGINDIAEKLDEKPYSGIPLENRRDWRVPKWLKELFVGFAILTLAALFASKAWQKYGGQLDRAAGSLDADLLKGNPAPDFTLETRGGGKVELNKLRGKLVLVNFWTTWCAPCREEEPSLDKMAAMFDPKSLEVLAVSADSGWEPVTKFFGTRTPAYQVALDDAKIHEGWGVTGFPESYLVDASGALTFKVIGPRDWTSPEAIALLTQLGARPLAAKN